MATIVDRTAIGDCIFLAKAVLNQAFFLFEMEILGI